MEECMELFYIPSKRVGKAKVKTKAKAKGKVKIRLQPWFIHPGVALELYKPVKRGMNEP